MGRIELNTTETLQKSNPPSARRAVWKIAWPAIAEQCLNLTVGLNEVFLIGHLSIEVSKKLGYESATALAAVSLGQFFNWVSLAAFNGIGIATTALVARSIGAKQSGKASDYGRQGLLMSLGLGLIVAVALYFFAPFLLFLLGAEGELLTVGTLFVKTTAFGFPLFALLIAGNACLRGSGDTRTPLVIMLIVNAVNVLVAWVFIHGNFGLPAFGVQGAAFGAVTSWTVGTLLVLARLLYGMRIGARLNGFLVARRLAFDKAMSKIILGQAFPTAAEQWVFQVGIFFFARLLVSEGTTTFAAHNVVINIDSISFLPGIGIGIATTVLVGQALGAGKTNEAEAYSWAAVKMGVAFMTVMGLLFIAVPEFFIGLLVSDPAVIAEATPALRVAGFFDPIIGLNFILMGALRGAGDTKFPLYGRMISSVGIRVSLAYLFIPALGWGLMGGRLAMGLDSVFLVVLIVWRFRSGRWKTIFQEKVVKKATVASEPEAELATAGAGGAKAAPAPTAVLSAPDAEG